MNYTEMEAKVIMLPFPYLAMRQNAKSIHQVREATNNEPWGASSTMMQEIANGTFN